MCNQGGRDVMHVCFWDDVLALLPTNGLIFCCKYKGTHPNGTRSCARRVDRVQS